MNLWIPLATVAIAAAALPGCRVYSTPGSTEIVTPATVEVTTAPIEVETAPMVVYEGRPTYYYENRWYYRVGPKWHVYRSEPNDLRRRRPVVRQAPPARPYHERPREAPPAYRR